MSDTRQRRIDVLKTAARRKSEEKTRSADSAIARLIKRREPVTFQAVQREAGVSHAFLYNNPDLRSRMSACAPRPARPPARPARQNPLTRLVLALTSKLTQLKKRHRQEIQELRAALEQAHGENLELRRELTRRGWSPQPAAT